MKLLPKTKYGKWSVGLIIAMPLLLYIGTSFVGFYEGVPSGRTIPADIIARPGYILSFVVALITAFVLTHITALSQDFYGFSKVQTGITTAFWVWLGFMMPVQTTNTIFGDKK